MSSRRLNDRWADRAIAGNEALAGSYVRKQQEITTRHSATDELTCWQLLWRPWEHYRSRAAVNDNAPYAKNRDFLSDRDMAASDLGGRERIEGFGQR